MKYHRLFNLFVLITVLVVVTMTVREAAATTVVVSQKSACASLSSQPSIYTDYVQERGMWMTYTQNGPTGVDGGLIQLLSDKRTCAK
jgi:hypothetical protein